MSYRNYKIIPTVIPGAGIGDAIMGLAAPIQNAMQDRAKAVEEENARIAEQQLKDETAELALIQEQNDRSDAENAAMEEKANGLKLNMGGEYRRSMDGQFFWEKAYNEPEATFEVKKEALQQISTQKRFRADLLSNIGGLGALKEQSVEAAGQDKNYKDDTAKALDQWGQGLGTWSITNGEGLEQYIENEQGETHLLPMDKIRSGDYDSFVITPKIMEASSDKFATKNKEIKARVGDNSGSYTPEDLGQMSVMADTEVRTVMANIESYATTDKLSTEAILTKRLGFPTETKDKGTSTVDTIMDGLYSGDVNKVREAKSLIQQNVANRVDKEMLTILGLERGKDGNFTEYKAPVDPSTDGDGTGAESAQAEKLRFERENIKGMRTNITKIVKGDVKTVMNVLGASNNAVFGKGTAAKVADKMDVLPDGKVKFTFTDRKDRKASGTKTFDFTNSRSVTDFLVLVNGLGRNQYTKALAEEIANKYKN
tara:strand:+ start:448 stop:1899 length:1452 start_codon:yes stop_codon:yes gene_type:complete